MNTCVLCGSECDPESPFLTGAVYEVNPRTMRKAWMCGHCLYDELEQSKTLPATKPEYDNRYDQWLVESELK